MLLSRSKRKDRLQSLDILLTATPDLPSDLCHEGESAGDADCRGSGSIGQPSVPSAVRWHRLRLRPARRARANLLVLLHALESLCKLRDQWSFAGLETALSHDAPEKIASRPLVRIVHGQ